MKKFSLIIVILLLCSMVFGTDQVSHRQCANPRRLRPLLQEMRDEFNGDTILFDQSGTFDNATNNIFEWNENGEGILWTFASNLVTMSSDSSAVFSFGTMTPNLDILDVDSCIYFNPTDTAPARTKGNVYCNDSNSAIEFWNGSSWTTLAAGTGDNTLDNAYDQPTGGAGAKIDADAGCVEIEVDDNKAGTAQALLIDYDDSTNNNDCLTIENAGTGIAIDVDGQQTGRDIEGSGATWYVTGLGVVYADSLILSGSTEIQMQNAANINNTIDTEIRFTEGGESFSIDFVTDEIDFKSLTGVVTVGWGDLDAHTGLNSITMDAASSAITLPTDGDAQDLLIQITGATNSGIVVQSTGTAADALVLNTTAGGMDLTNGGAAGGEDLDISSSSSSVNISAAEDVAESITITASAGGIDIVADGASAKDLDLTCTNGSVNVTAGESGADSVVITSSIGGIQIYAAGAADTEDIDIKATGSSVFIESTQATANAIKIDASNAAGGIDIDAGTADIDIDCTDGEILLDNDGAGKDIKFTSDAGSILVKADQTSVTNSIWLDGAGGIDIDAVDDLVLTCTSAAGSDDLKIEQTGAQDAGVLVHAEGTGDDALDLNASAGGVDIDGVKSVTITSTEDEDDAMVINTTNGGLQITCSGAEAAEDLEITAAASLQLTSAESGVVDGILIKASNESRIDVQGPVNLNSTFCLFEDEPIFAKWGKDGAPVWGGACTGATGDENVMTFPSASFIYHILGAVQTELGPQMRAGGLDISMDDTADEGIEITPNILGKAATGGSRQAFTAQTDAFYLKVKIYITDTDGTDDLCVGFRKVEAFQAGVNSYQDYVLLRNNAGDIYIESDLNGAAAASDDTNDNWADTTAVTLGIFVDVAGAVTYTIDGSAPSATQTFTFDSGDIIVPFLYFLHHTNAAELTYLQEWECGLQY